MNTTRVSNRAGRRLGNTSIAMMALTILSAFAQDSTINGRPDLRGLWQALDPGNPKTVVMSFNVSQAGNGFTLQVIIPGKPDLVMYEGAFEGAGLIVGKFLDLNSPPENRKWTAVKAIVTDANHLKFDDGTVLTRATPSQAAYFKENKRISALPLPARPFDLNGTWSYVSGASVSVGHVGSEVTLQTARLGDKPYFRGQYTRNPDITGQAWARGSTAENPRWIEGKITVQDPDHIIFGGKILYRASSPAPHDLPCDDQNTNHVRDYYAALRGTMAVKEQDYKAGTCWLIIGAGWGYAPAQSMLAGLLVAAKKPDYATAFDLVTESARQGDVDGEKLLARLYREGKGTPADLAKAQLWERRAADAQSLAMVKQAMTPGNIGTAIKSFWETFGGQLDFDLSMMPQNCFSRDVLNQGNPKVPCR